LNKVAALSLGESGNVQRQTCDFSYFRLLVYLCSKLSSTQTTTLAVTSLGYANTQEVTLKAIASPAYSTLGEPALQASPDSKANG